MEKTPLVWEGRTLDSYSSIMDIVLKAKTKEEAQKFFAHYVKWCEENGMDEETAKSNIGYLAGYYDEKARRKVFDFLGAVHPIFGNNFSPTAEEAFQKGFEMGKELAEKHKEKK